jgi:hypothetical protein
LSLLFFAQDTSPIEISSKRKKPYTISDQEKTKATKRHIFLYQLQPDCSMLKYHQTGHEFIANKAHNAREEQTG